MKSIREQLDPIFKPRSIAVIGASRQPGSIGNLVFQNIMEGGFTGVVYPVNPKADAIMAVKAYPSVLDVPGDVDLGIIIVPGNTTSKNIIFPIFAIKNISSSAPGDTLFHEVILIFRSGIICAAKTTGMPVVCHFPRQKSTTDKLGMIPVIYNMAFGI